MTKLGHFALVLSSVVQTLGACDPFATEDSAVVYLRRADADGEHPCVMKALRRLAHHKNPENVELLVRFIDTGHFPLTFEEQREQKLYERPPSLHDGYPALVPLWTLRKAAEPHLRKVIFHPEVKISTFQNAMSILGGVWRLETPAVIRLYKDLAKRHRNPVVRDFLLESARSAVLHSCIQPAELHRACLAEWNR